ncbi:MAG: hypothetical protein AAFV53_41425 [Myxococcota bacterium]
MRAHRGLACVLLVACTDGPDSAAPDSSLRCGAAPTLEIGSSESDWLGPLQTDDPVTMVHGPQNGWHMLASVYLERTEPIVDIHVLIETLDGVAVADNTYAPVRLKEDGSCAGYFTGMYGYITVSGLTDDPDQKPPDVLGGETLWMTVSVQDAVGRAVSGAVQITAALDPIDQR